MVQEIVQEIVHKAKYVLFSLKTVKLPSVRKQSYVHVDHSGNVLSGANVLMVSKQETALNSITAQDLSH